MSLSLCLYIYCKHRLLHQNHISKIPIILLLCIRGTSHGPVSVCLSVRLSVTSQSSTKRLNVGSHTEHRTIAHESSFQVSQISAKFDRDHPMRQMQVGWVKIGELRQITGYNISSTVQDSRMVSIKVE